MDVFLSYASEDRERARQVARALEDAGWTVWWDRKIVAGETFDQTIERYLDAAKCVVVLWSSASVESEWVKTEAAAAAERNVLVPALLDDVKIPLEFRRRQTANLIGWDGNTSEEGFQALREGVAARVGAPAAVPSPRPPLSRRSDNPVAWRRWALVAGAIAVVAVGVWALRDARDSPSGAGLNVAQSNVITPSGENSVDRPAPLRLGALHKVTLEKNGEYYFRLPAAMSAMTIVQDVRLANGGSSNLQTELDVLDADGGVIRRQAIGMNEIDSGYRKTASFSIKQPSAAGLKLANNSGTADIWVAVLPEGKKEFLPFFGTVVPQSWSAGKAGTGTLDRYENAYYVVRLPRGEHRVIVDFTNAKRDNTNIQGYLAVLDANGGGQQRLVGFNEIGVSHRMVGSLTIKGDEPVILRIQNTNQAVNYSLQIATGQ